MCEMIKQEENVSEEQLGAALLAFYVKLAASQEDMPPELIPSDEELLDMMDVYE